MRRVVMQAALPVICALFLAVGARAADPGADTETPARETQNPVADLISVPFQNTLNFGAGPDRDMIWMMNVQPVIPIPLNEQWNLITRTIVPIVDLPGLLPGEPDSFGIAPGPRAA